MPKNFVKQVRRKRKQVAAVDFPIRKEKHKSEAQKKADKKKKSDSVTTSRESSITPTPSIESDSKSEEKQEIESPSATRKAEEEKRKARVGDTGDEDETIWSLHVSRPGARLWMDQLLTKRRQMTLLKWGERPPRWLGSKPLPEKKKPKKKRKNTNIRD